MATRLESDSGEGGAQFAQLGDIGAVETALPFIPSVTQTNLMPAVVALLEPARKDLQGRCTSADQAITDSATEAATVRQQVQSLEDTGFSGPVATDQQVQAWTWFQANLPKAAYIGDVELLELH